ncbi:Ldh family oxidoreductase [Mycobacterium sp. AMU20-3851]|uniref:Ldh family oxidoreductase n=1 Tax=Mycobacterium sp. AMU20-3851 TaxID=3122055 RepID=UPI003753ED51
MTTSLLTVSVQDAWQTTVNALREVGVPDAHAGLQADLLVDAEARGLPSHGLLRLPRVIERIRNGVTDPVTTGDLQWRGSALASVDGRNGLGPVVGWHALQAISQRCRSGSGIAAAAVHATNHLGMLAWYARRVAADGLTCVVLTTSEALMHPYGGRKAMVGSNPIAIGVPADPRPLVFDMATSSVSMGKIHDHALRGAPLQPGWALDEHGEPTTDAQSAIRGAIAPFGGPKGYGLGLAFEVLVTALTGAALGTSVAGTLDSIHPANKGDVFIVAEAHHSREISHYLDEVRSSPPAEPAAPVRIPGDQSDIRRAAAETGGLHLPVDLWRQITSLAHEQKGSR